MSLVWNQVLQKSSGMTVMVGQYGWGNTPDSQKSATFSQFRTHLSSIVKSGDILLFVEEYMENDAWNTAWKDRVMEAKLLADQTQAKLLVVTDLHNVGSNPQRCVLMRSSCQGPAPTSQAASYRNTAIQLAQQGVLVFDAYPLMCAGTTCNLYVPGTQVPAFFDTHHLNRNGEQYMAPFLCSFLERHGIPAQLTRQEEPKDNSDEKEKSVSYRAALPVLAASLAFVACA